MSAPDLTTHESSFVRDLAALAAQPTPPGASAEAVIAHRIRANVLEILAKMHLLHHDAVWHGRGKPELLGLDDSLPPAARVADAWERFVTTLQTEWSERLAADVRFGRDAEAGKGRAQLAAIDEALAAWQRHRPAPEDGDASRA